MLCDDINKALTEAMKAKNERAVSTLRMVNSSLKNADIEARGAGKPPLVEPVNPSVNDAGLRRPERLIRPGLAA